MKRKIIFIEIISTILTVLVLFAVSCIYINNQNHKTAEDELLTYSNIACEIFDGLNFEEALTMPRITPGRPRKEVW